MCGRREKIELAPCVKHKGVLAVQEDMLTLAIKYVVVLSCGFLDRPNDEAEWLNV